MYTWHEFRHLAGAGVGAALLCELGTCQAVLLQITSGVLDGVRVFNRRTGGLPEEAALCFCCEGQSVRRSVFALTVVTPQGPGILSLRYA